MSLDDTKRRLRRAAATTRRRAGALARALVPRRSPHGGELVGREGDESGHQPSAWRGESARVGETNSGLVSAERIEFRCNICGSQNSSRPDQLGREQTSCGACGSTVRFRGVIHALARELFGAGLALPDFPIRRDLRGLGMSDWTGYAQPLAEKFDYTNTYFHREPMLDITRVPESLWGTYDFVISSEVFEHVPPPVEVAFENLHRLLRPGGVAIFTVPYSLGARTIEHFPTLHDWSAIEEGDQIVLRNVTSSGEVETFDDLVFHGGEGATLEFRLFSEAGLREAFAKAGFSRVEIYGDTCVPYGIVWEGPWSLPFAARA